MKKRYFLICILCLLFAGLAAAATNTCSPRIALINQNPYPALPDSYVELVFQVSNVNSVDCKDGVWFSLQPSYPFSLDDNDSLRVLEANTFVSGYKDDWMIPYRVRIDKDAFDGTYKLDVRYGYNAAYRQSDFFTKSFNVTIEDMRTDFDTIIQSVSGSEVTIAVANTGKNAANAVIVKIPDQNDFMATDTTGQMVGNLASGDYTAVTFNIARKGNFSRMGNSTSARQRSAEQNLSQFNMPQSSQLKFDIYYTDGLGQRRVVNNELFLNLDAGSAARTGTFAGRTTSTSLFSSVWVQVTLICIVVLVVAWVAIRYRRRKKTRGGREDNSPPDWAAEPKGRKK